MKRQALIRELEAAGCRLQRHGARHDIDVNPGDGLRAPVPRHAEIADTLARLIKRQLGIA